MPILNFKQFIYSKSFKDEVREKFFLMKESDRFYQDLKKRMMVSVFEANTQARSFYERQGGKLIDNDHVDLAGVRYPTSTYLWIF